MEKHLLKDHDEERQVDLDFIRYFPAQQNFAYKKELIHDFTLRSSQRFLTMAEGGFSTEDDCGNWESNVEDQKDEVR